MSAVVADQIGLIVSVLSGGLAFGFVAGYAVRAYLSYQRRVRRRHRTYLVTPADLG